MTSGRWAKGYTLTELNSARQKCGLVFFPRTRRSIVGEKPHHLTARLVLGLAFRLACSLRVLDALLLG
jgi:hypothetical protein